MTCQACGQCSSQVSLLCWCVEPAVLVRCAAKLNLAGVPPNSKVDSCAAWRPPAMHTLPAATAASAALHISTACRISGVQPQQHLMRACWRCNFLYCCAATWHATASAACTERAAAEHATRQSRLQGCRAAALVPHAGSLPCRVRAHSCRSAQVTQLCCCMRPWSRSKSSACVPSAASAAGCHRHFRTAAASRRPPRPRRSVPRCAAGPAAAGRRRRRRRPASRTPRAAHLLSCPAARNVEFCS